MAAPAAAVQWRRRWPLRRRCPLRWLLRADMGLLVFGLCAEPLGLASVRFVAMELRNRQKTNNRQKGPTPAGEYYLPGCRALPLQGTRIASQPRALPCRGF